MTALVATFNSFENNSFMPADQDTVFAVPFNCACQDLAFGVSPLCGQVVNRQTVVNTGDVLLDDGALVQVCRYVMGGGTDQFNASVMRLKIRFCTLEAG